MTKSLGLAIIALVFAGCTSSPEITAESLKAPFADNKAQTDACYEKTLKKQPDLGTGTVELKFLIGDNGKAYKTIFLKKRSTLTSKLLNACLKKVVHGWQFPEGKALEVVYPFHFEGLGNNESQTAESTESTPPASTDEPKKQSEMDIIDNSPQDETSGDEETPAE